MRGSPEGSDSAGGGVGGAIRPDVRSMRAEDLALRAARGDAFGKACFAQLVDLYQARLFTFLVRRGESATDAEELTQEAFLRAWARLESYDPRWQFSTWLYTISLRLAISRRRRTPLVLMRETPDTPAREDSRDDERRSLGARLWALAAEHLTQDQHTALWLRYAENLDIPEIARVMGKSRVAVRVCLFRARQHLAGLMPQAPAAEHAPRRVRRPSKSGLHALAQAGLGGGLVGGVA